jgi:hypothetical protein
MEEILCIVQRYVNGLINFERVGSRWRMTNEVDALPPAETSKQSRKCVIHREFVPGGQTVNGQFYLGVMERLLKRIRRVRPEFHNS